MSNDAAKHPAQTAYDRIQRTAAIMPLVHGPVTVTVELNNQGLLVHGTRSDTHTETSILVAWNGLALSGDDQLAGAVARVLRELDLERSKERRAEGGRYAGR